jgi:hypothetical protein
LDRVNRFKRPDSLKQQVSDTDIENSSKKERYDDNILQKLAQPRSKSKERTRDTGSGKKANMVGNSDFLRKAVLENNLRNKLAQEEQEIKDAQDKWLADIFSNMTTE